METLMQKIYNYQLDLEDAFVLETTIDEAKETDDGRKLIRYLKKRRRAIVRVLNILDRF